MVLLWLACATTAPALAPLPPDEAPRAEPQVSLTVVPGVTLTAGVSGYLGVRYTISPGWHIYWENPGDSGIATELQLRLPEGDVATATQFPAPVTLVSAGNIVNYGYHDEVTLLVPVTPGPTPGPRVVTAESRWLMCKDDRCVPGSGTASGDYTVGTAAGPDPLQAARAALPRPLHESGLRVVESADSWSVELQGTRLELYPSLGLEPALGPRAPASDAVGRRVDLTLDRAGLGPDARLVLRTDAGTFVTTFAKEYP